MCKSILLPWESSLPFWSPWVLGGDGGKRQVPSGRFSWRAWTQGNWTGPDFLRLQWAWRNVLFLHVDVYGLAVWVWSLPLCARSAAQISHLCRLSSLLSQICSPPRRTQNFSESAALPHSEFYIPARYTDFFFLTSFSISHFGIIMAWVLFSEVCFNSLPLYFSSELPWIYSSCSIPLRIAPRFPPLQLQARFKSFWDFLAANNSQTSA